MVEIQRPLPLDGQAPRITELFVWTAIDPMTDTEGIVSAVLPQGGGLPLVSSIRRVAENMRPWAEMAALHAEAPRPIVRLRRFVEVE